MEKKILTEFGEINYSVVRERRRSIGLKFHNSSTLIISIPRYSLVNIDGLINKHMGWIIKHASEIANSRELIKGNEILCVGRYYRMEFALKLGRPKVTLFENSILIESRDRAAGVKAIANFMKGQTKQIISPILEEKLRVSGKEIRSVKYRKMRKWGYCTSDKKIKFNAYLSMLPIEIVDYIVSHEVSHLTELNHSKEFWKVVYGLCPNYRELRKELKRYNVSSFN